MKQKIQKIFAAALLSMSLFLVGVSLASAQTSSDGCSGFANFFSYKDASGKSHNLVTGLPKFCSAGQAIAWVIERLLYFSGAVAVVTIMLGGFWYLTAAGNDEQAEKGRKTLTTSIIGLIVVIMAATIVRIVANTLTEDIGSGGVGSNTTQNQTPNNTNQQNNGGIVPIDQPGNGDGGNAPTNDLAITGNNSVNLNDGYAFLLRIPTALASQCSDGELNLDDVSVSVVTANGSRAALSPNGSIQTSGTNFVALNFITEPVKNYGYIQPQTFMEGQFKITASVCGKTSEFNVQIQGNSNNGSASGNSPQSIALALQNSSFTLTPYASETAYTVNIAMTNTSQEALCGNSSNPNIQLVYKGNVAATESVTVRQFNINSVPANFNTSEVQIKVCGHALSQK